MTQRYLCLIPVAALALPATAAAEWRCDCTTITASCSAEISLAEEFIEVTTDTNQCARVDYFIDGRPFVAVVTEGRQRQDWISRSTDADVLVQGCQVCRDNAGTAEAPADQATRTAGSQTPTLEPLIEVVPSYPENAGERSGYVELEFTVEPSGEVGNVSVVDSEPGSLFDDAAVAAVRRWRYPADSEREPQQVTERLEFEAGARAPAAAAPAAETEPAEAARTGNGPANQCVRESAAYNYGEMIEVALINACDEPLAVHACAEGVGPRQNRWHCIGADSRRQLLVPQSDPRLGDSVVSSTREGLGSFDYVADMFLTRAPNTQYWWLACRVEDMSCRAAAREWVRAVDGQLARIDPQLRAPVRVSRSY